MLRLAVTAYLTVVSATGPWVCCCTASRIAALLDSRSGKTSAPRRCCGHHTGQSRAPKHDHVPGPEAPCCPCPLDPSRSPAAALGSYEPTKQFEAREAERASSAPFLSPDVDPCSGRTCPQGTPRGLSALPFLTADDILRAFHILRC